MFPLLRTAIAFHPLDWGLRHNRTSRDVLQNLIGTSLWPNACASEISLIKSESLLQNSCTTESSKPTVRTFPEFARISASRSNAPVINTPTSNHSSTFSIKSSWELRIYRFCPYLDLIWFLADFFFRIVRTSSSDNHTKNQTHFNFPIEIFILEWNFQLHYQS